VNSWKETTLGEVLGEKGYIRGPFGSSLRRNELSTEGIPVYEQQNAIYDNREFRYFIDNQKYEELSRFTVKEHDLIISCSGTIGKISIIKRDDPIGIISQALLILRPDATQILPKYLYYFFISVEGFNSLVSRSSGSVQVNIAERKIIQGIELSLPSIPEQEAIINILAGLDDKIELLRRQNKTLEQIAQTIFKEWFVNFIVNGEKLKVNSKTGLPEGWRMGGLGDYVDIFRGSSPRPITSPEFFSNGNIPWIKIADATRSGGMYLNETKEFCTEAALPYTRYLKKGAMILSNSATIGVPIILNIDGCIHDGWLSFRNYKLLTRNFLYFLLRSQLQYFQQLADGSVQKNLNTKILQDMSFCVPPESLIKSFDSFSTPIFNKILHNETQIQTLSKLRDSLLPKLMKGEIRVKL
jgi:type I restriction enzyme S subunit